MPVMPRPKASKKIAKDLKLTEKVKPDQKSQKPSSPENAFHREIRMLSKR